MPRNNAEVIMDALWEHHEASHLEESMLQLGRLGYSQETVDFAFNPSNYYFPNVRHNEITKPSSVVETAIPVVALEPGIEYKYEPIGLHPFQRIALKGLGFHHFDIKHIEKSLVSKVAPLTTAENGVGSACIHNELTDHKVAGSAMIQSAPTLIFNVSREAPDPEDYTSVALHEPVHIVQMLEKPLRKLGNLTQAMQHELEAYAVQSKLHDNYYVKFNSATRMAKTVDMFREEHLGTDGFTPDDYFMRAAAQHEIIGKVVRSLM